MAANALVQARIDAGVKERATVVLNNMGLTLFFSRTPAGRSAHEPNGELAISRSRVVCP